MTVTPLNILIVGNGIAGPVAAMALQKVSKHKVVLVDAGPEETKPIGAAVGIAPNGLKALHFIGADHIVTEKGGKVEGFSVGDAETADMWMDVKVLDTYMSEFGYALHGVVRQDLMEGLRGLAKERGIEMRFNMRLETIEQIDNTVKAHFKNGETLECDLLIGCDGLHSPTRAFVVGKEEEPSFAGVSIVLGMATLSPEEQAKVPKALQLWRGNTAMCGSLPCDKKGTYSCFTVWRSEDPAGGEAEWSKGDNSAETYCRLAESKIASFKAVQPHIIVPKMWRAFPLGLYDRDPIKTWHKGRVVLVGDSAHPTTPFGGQGSQMAMESAVILARLLADNEPSDELFTRYHNIRHHRTDRVTLNARRGIKLQLFLPWPLNYVPQIIFRLFGNWFFRAGFGGFFNYDAGTALLN